MPNNLENFILCAHIVVALFFLGLFIQRRTQAVYLLFVVSVLLWCCCKSLDNTAIFFVAWLGSLPLLFYPDFYRKTQIAAAAFALALFMLLLLHTQPYRVEFPMVAIYVVDAAYLLLAWRLLRHFSNALSKADHLNQQLAQRIASAKQQIEQHHQRQHAHKLKRALQSESRQIFSDLHDEIGAGLLTLVHSTQLDEERNLARFALQDLRDTVALHNGNSQDLVDILAAICTEVMHHFENAQRELVWQQDASCDGGIWQLDEQTTLQLKRLVRELARLVLNHEQLTLHLQWQVHHDQLGLRLNQQQLQQALGEKLMPLLRPLTSCARNEFCFGLQERPVND